MKFHTNLRIWMTSKNSAFFVSPVCFDCYENDLIATFTVCQWLLLNLTLWKLYKFDYSLDCRFKLENVVIKRHENDNVWHWLPSVWIEKCCHKSLWKLFDKVWHWLSLNLTSWKLHKILRVSFVFQLKMKTVVINCMEMRCQRLSIRFI